MYVYYVCLLLLSEFNKCWREWSHTDNEIDENQKKTIAATKKYNYCDFLLLFAEWVNEEKQATRISKMYYTLFHWWKLTINFNVFDRRRHWVFLSFEQKKKKKIANPLLGTVRTTNVRRQKQLKLKWENLKKNQNVFFIQIDQSHSLLHYDRPDHENTTAK